MVNGYTNRICGVGLPPTSPTEEIKKVNITMGVFFDGTKNNKYNIDFGDNIKKGWRYLTSKVKTTDSYESSYSNVAKLWDMYYVNNKGNADSIAKVYIEGPGTSSPERDWNSKFKDEEGFVSSKEGDSTGGSAFGNGQTGVNAKVERACDLICQKLSSLIRDNTITLGTLTLDVFGFSRGAAEARCFVNCIEKDKRQIANVSKRIPMNSWGASYYKIVTSDEIRKYKVCLRNKLPERFKKIKIKVRFMGIFDTVSSFSPEGLSSLDFTNDVKELALNIPKSMPSVEEIVHFVAADEYRENFSLTTIDSASNGMQVVLPGAHSDVGGGYNEHEKEKIILEGSWTDSKREYRGYMSLEELKREGWLPPTWNVPVPTFMPDGSVRNYKDTMRHVFNDYARIPLYAMWFLSIKKSKLLYKANAMNKEYSLRDKKLIQVRTLIMGKINNNNNMYEIKWDSKGPKNKGRLYFVGTGEEKKLIHSIRAEYIHLSAHRSTWPIHPHEATKDNQRIFIKG